jgi:ribosomal protein S18 acetylase RimI-like enzyme
MNADAIGRYCLKILSSANHVVFLLMQEDTVVGQVMATEAVGDIDERFLSVYGLYVVPDYRRKAGVNDLLRACAEEARSRNLTSCEFILAPDNETLFYERIGCKLAGKVYRYEVTNEQQDVCG